VPGADIAALLSGAACATYFRGIDDARFNRSTFLFGAAGPGLPPPLYDLCNAGRHTCGTSESRRVFSGHLQAEFFDPITDLIAVDAQ
jgi:hypothetical protein